MMRGHYEAVLRHYGEVSGMRMASILVGTLRDWRSQLSLERK